MPPKVKDYTQHHQTILTPHTFYILMNIFQVNWVSQSPFGPPLYLFLKETSGNNWHKFRWLDALAATQPIRVEAVRHFACLRSKYQSL